MVSFSVAVILKSEVEIQNEAAAVDDPSHTVTNCSDRTNEVTL